MIRNFKHIPTRLLLVALAVLAGFSAQPAAGTGLLVPAYFYPKWWDAQANQWDDLIDAAARVPLLAIVNPASGPGSASNPDYTRAVDELRVAGGQALGYVYTAYGTRPLADVLADVDAYYAWYAVDGIYFDAAANDAEPALLAYYQSAYDYVRARDPAARVVLGQGTSAPEEYAAVATQLTVREGDDQLTPFLDWQPRPWTDTYSADRFNVFVYNVADADAMRAAVDHALAHNVAWLYFTDDILPNPWNSLPAYWTDEVDYLAGNAPSLVSVDHLTSTRLVRKGSYRRSEVTIRARVTNTSTAALAGPLLLVVESTSDPSVSVVNADGLTDQGKPYFDLSARISGDAFDPGETTAQWNMLFGNPARQSFTVQTGVYQQILVSAAKRATSGTVTLDPPDGYELAPGYPNPFNASTRIAYQLPDPVEVHLTVFNALGQQIRLLVRGRQQAGNHQVNWNGEDDSGRAVSSGVYFFRLQSGSFAQTRQMLLLR